MALDCLQVKTELPLTAMTTSGKLLAERAIDGVKERGHTNLSGGLLAALEALYRHGTSNISYYYSAFNIFSLGTAGYQKMRPHKWNQFSCSLMGRQTLG